MVTESQKLILLEDVSSIVVGSHALHETLDHITALLADRLGVEVCSIYLMENGRLVLRSSKGLAPQAVGTVSMAVDEGLTGLAFESRAPVNAPEAERHPRYKFFPGIGEEAFHSYLGIPLLHRSEPIGVLTVQTVRPRLFAPDEVRLLVTAASQLSSIIAHASLLDAHAKAEGAAREPRPPLLRGIGASPGVAEGVAFPLAETPELSLGPEQPARAPEVELAAFEEALAASVNDVIAIRDQVSGALSEEDGAIFHAHLMMLEDRALQDKVRAQIRGGASAARAVASVARSYVEAFRSLKDAYLRERAADVRDIAQRLLRHLREGGPDATAAFDEPTVLLADDVTPSELVRLLQPNLTGVVLARGGQNSHAAILCRSAGIPAVVGLESALPPVRTGEPVILDGNAGMVYLSPAPAVTSEYRRLARDSARLQAEYRTHVGEPAVTRDGFAVRLFGNAALLSDIPKIVEAGAEGVGLYRTEFPFLIRSSFPDEEEQLDVYAKILAALGGRTATLRTLDVGGDKTLPYLPLPREENPHLGWRSIRVSLELQEPFRIQLRALLRASLLGPVRIVFPMISTAEELRRARAVLDEERERLRERGIAVGEVPVGAMVEVPSAALSIDRMAAYADFFSVGTNDLVQYLLAVDRANRKVAHLYDPLHPAVLQVIGMIAEAAAKSGKPVSVCGEMAGRVLGAAALIGLGIAELSLSPGVLPRIRRLVQLVDRSRLSALAPGLVAASGAAEVRSSLSQELRAQGVPSAFLDLE